MYVKAKVNKIGACMELEPSIIRTPLFQEFKMSNYQKNIDHAH